MESDYRIYFEYSRIPNHYISVPKKGQPKVRHLHLYKQGVGFSNDAFCNYPPLSKGGRVECHIGNETGTAAIGIANCSYSDNFCYRVGRAIALGRAKKRLEKETKQ